MYPKTFPTYRLLVLMQENNAKDIKCHSKPCFYYTLPQGPSPHLRPYNIPNAKERALTVFAAGHGRGVSNARLQVRILQHHGRHQRQGRFQWRAQRIGGLHRHVATSGQLAGTRLLQEIQREELQ